MVKMEMCCSEGGTRIELPGGNSIRLARALALHRLPDGRIGAAPIFALFMPVVPSRFGRRFMCACTPRCVAGPRNTPGDPSRTAHSRRLPL
jgi:hypothetical protein